MNHPQLATISFAVCAIPGEPIYSQVAEASLAVTERCQNRNIIDNVRFPTHLTLVISGTDDKGIARIVGDLGRLRFPVGGIALASDLTISRRRVIGVKLTGDVPHLLQEAILGPIGEALAMQPLIRPHLAQRWMSLSASEQASTIRVGSYKVGDNFDAHLTIASVDTEHVEEMREVCRAAIPIPQPVVFTEIQVVDVGHENEKWDILGRLPLHPSPVT